MAWHEGQNFAGYTIIQPLGSGGMGEVYLARHPHLPRRDALKVLNKDISGDDDFRRRFIREADLAAALWHPNIVRVNDRGDFHGELWIAMDFVDGTDAASLLRDRYPVGMPAEEVTAIVSAIASALDYAHAQGLLHRDVKPANILLSSPEHGDRRILLTDFGIARNIGEISGLTATNMTIGTLPYAAPEQLTDATVDGRADQYALAATAYHLLTGSALFPRSNPVAVISSHLSEPPPTLADTRPELAAFDPVLAVALAKNPNERFARCTDFAAAFAEAAGLGGYASASASTMQAPIVMSPRSPAVPGARRPRRGMAIAAAAMLAVAAAGVIGYRIQQTDQPAAVLDGTYRLEFDKTGEKANGVPDPAPGPGAAVWEAFRSACTSSGCVATATELQSGEHQVAKTPPATDILRFVDGRWQGTANQREATGQQCLGDNGKAVGKGTETMMSTSSLVPQPDGTLRGVITDTILTNECGQQSMVYQMPLVATRTGDVPPGATAADPATVTASPTTAAQPPPAAGPVLDGTYRLYFEYVKQTVNGATGTLTASNNETHWWAFRSLCTSAGCVATGVQLSDTDHTAAKGGAHALRFADDHWQDTPYLERQAPCPSVNKSAEDIDTISWSWAPQSDGTLHGTLTDVTVAGECGDQGTVYRTPMVITRIGDVPPGLVVADPMLFADPALFKAPGAAGGQR
jgi:serine/threonine-protein kinase